VSVPSDDVDTGTAEPPGEFDEYELFILLRGANPPKLDDEAADLLQRRHLGYLRAMLDAGHMKVAGPFAEQADETWRGLGLYQVGSVEEAERLARQDPAVRAGQLDVAVMKWFCEKGAISFSEPSDRS